MNIQFPHAKDCKWSYPQRQKAYCSTPPPPHLFWQTVAPLPPPLFRVDRSGLGPGVHGSVCCIYCGAIGIGCGRNLRGALGRATAKTPKSDLASTPLLMKSQFGMGSPQQNIAVPHWLSTATSGNWKLRCKLWIQNISDNLVSRDLYKCHWFLCSLDK